MSVIFVIRTIEFRNFWQITKWEKISDVSSCDFVDSNHKRIQNIILGVRMVVINVVNIVIKKTEHWTEENKGVTRSRHFIQALKTVKD
jgi:hypothetical protein